MEVYFASQTRAKISQLKNQLKNTKKTGPLNDYLLSIKKTVDTLTAVGSPIGDPGHIQVILDGLSDEYDPLVASILSRTDAYSIPEIESLIMALEERLEKHKKNSPDSFDMQSMQANLAQTQHFSNGRGNHRGGRSNYNGNGNYRG